MGEGHDPTRQNGPMEPDDRAWVAPESGAEPLPPGSLIRSPPLVAGVGGAPQVAPPAPVGPMTVSDILDGSYTVIRRRPRAVIGAVAVVVVPVQVLSVWLRSTSSAPEQSSPYDAVLTLGSSTSLALTLLIAAIASLSLFFVGGVISSFVGAWYAGRDITGREALRRSIGRAGPFLVAWAVLMPLKVVSYAFCFLPLAVTVTFFALTAPAITLENVGPFAGIKRSAQLIARRFWPSLGIVLLAGLIETVSQLSLSAIPLIISALVPGPADWIVLAVGNAGAALIATTALVAVSVLLYVDLRARTEGLDLELRAVDAFERTD
jgi:hypothetical protein